MSTIGFDTSNYTTSTAWTDGKNDINVRQILYVKDGRSRLILKMLRRLESVQDRDV